MFLILKIDIYKFVKNMFVSFGDDTSGPGLSCFLFCSAFGLAINCYFALQPLLKIFVFAVFGSAFGLALKVFSNI